MEDLQKILVEIEEAISRYTGMDCEHVRGAINGLSQARIIVQKKINESKTSNKTVYKKEGSK